MTDTLLIIGNGFDLAMGSKTSYSDFLWFIEEVNRLCSLFKTNYAKYRSFEELFQEVFDEQLTAVTKSFVYDPRNGKKPEGIISKSSTPLKKEILDKYITDQNDFEYLKNLFSHNAFVDYILENKAKLGQSWADFEHHISDIAEAIDELTKRPTQYEPVGIFLDSIEYSDNSHYRYTMTKGCYRYHSNGPAFDYVLNVIYSKFQNSSLSISLLMKAVNQYFIKELDELTLMLQFYLVYLEQEEADLTRKDTALDAIRTMEDSYLVTFNYTNTARNFLEIAKERIHHIHGQINPNNLQENNMVFGIEDKADLINPVTIDYQKYYQRITKGTGSQYKKFFDEFSGDLNIVIFGHSLDPLDKEIFQDIFQLAETYGESPYMHQLGYRLIVTYHSEEAKRSLVRNLSLILGKEELIRLTGEEKLHFIKSNDVKQMFELLLKG